MEKKRDYNIDFFRGIATIWIIFIHTCFWSGASYVPVWLQSFSLIIDVPLFMFISGMSFNFHNSIFKIIKSFIDIWKKYLIFMIVYFIIIFIIDKDCFTLSNIVHGFFFNLPAENKLKVVEGSFWFIYMFITSSLISAIIIKIYNYFFKDSTNFIYVLLFSFIIYGMKLYYPSFIFVDIQTLFYVFIYLLGYYLYNYKINGKTYVIFEILLLLVLYIFTRSNDYGFMNMQEAKFGYHINYLFYSFISISTVIYLKDKLLIKENNLFCFVGRNALLFYFCQGIGASIIYYLFRYLVDFPLFIKLLLMFMMNFIITSLFTLLLIYLVSVVTQVISSTKNSNIFKGLGVTLK